MAEIVTEKFAQNLYCDPSGQKKIAPTIFDELRWAMQHGQFPLEQTVQMISEFHGPWTGMSQNLMSLVRSLGTSSSSRSYMAAAEQAVDLLNQLAQSNPSAIGRINNIIGGQMNVPLLREFVSKSQSLHPSVNNFIQMNIGKYPYFQQISESVCQHGQIVLTKNEIPPMDRLKSGGAKTMDTNAPVARTTGDKMFEKCYDLIETTDNLLNTLFLRAMPVENSMGLLNTSYGKGNNPLSHGHSFAMDGFNAKRAKDAVQPCIARATAKFGPSLELVDTFFPVKYEIENTPQFFSLVGEGETYVADKLNRPVTREPQIPITMVDKKSAYS